MCKVLRDHAGVVSESQRVRQRKRDRERELCLFGTCALHCLRIAIVWLDRLVGPIADEIQIGTAFKVLH